MKHNALLYGHLVNFCSLNDHIDKNDVGVIITLFVETINEHIELVLEKTSCVLWNDKTISYVNESGFLYQDDYIYGKIHYVR